MKNLIFNNINENFMDEIDAISKAEEFINLILNHYAAITPNLELETHNIVKPEHVIGHKATHVLDGASYTIWHREEIIATANVRRTPNYNYSYLTCNVIQENINKIKPFDSI
jgi:predicted transglutaminase-like protease